MPTAETHCYFSALNKLKGKSGSDTFKVAKKDRPPQPFLVGQRRSAQGLYHRKARSLLTIVQRCENWPAIIAAKMGMHPNLREVRMKDGLRLRSDQGAMAAWGEIFEPAVADAYGVADFPADLIVDVGANIGSFSCRAARSHPDATVYAFEPNPDAARQARANFALNRIENVHLIESAATQDGRNVVLYLNPSPGGVSIVLMGEDEGLKVAMRSVTLDVVPFRKASSVFIKMDCEGAEAELVAWIVDHIELLPPRILIAGEYHAWCPHPADQLIATLRQADFQAELIPQFGATYFRAERSLRA